VYVCVEARVRVRKKKEVANQLKQEKKQKSDLIKGAARKKIEEGAEQLVRDRTSKREILRVR
jgi:hypothetical protein